MAKRDRRENRRVLNLDPSDVRYVVDISTGEKRKVTKDDPKTAALYRAVYRQGNSKVGDIIED